jgi:hypothetical protein
VDNPYFENNPATTGTGFTDDSFNFVKICLPLTGSGIFRNPKIFPLMLTQGLRIEILLEEAHKCVNQLIQGYDTSYCPRVDGAITLPALVDNANAAELSAITAAATTNNISITFSTTAIADRYSDGTSIKLSGIAGATWTALNDTTFFMKRTTSAADKKFDLFTTRATDGTLTTNVTNAGATGDLDIAAAKVTVQDIVLDELTLKDANRFKTLEQCPFVVNETISIFVSSTYSFSSKITNIALSGGKLVLTLASPSLTATIAADSEVVSSLPSDFKPQYVLDEVELVLQKIVMPQGYISTMMKSMKEAGMIRYDFSAMQTYKYSMLSFDTEGTIMLPLQNSRAKAILCCPVDASSYTPDKALREQVGYGFRGIPDNITEYRFLYNGKMNPDRPVPLSLVSSDLQEQQHLIELDKSLAMSGIIPSSMQQFSKCFIVPRAFSLQGGSYDTRTKDFQLQVSYRGTAPAKNKLWHILVSHIRSIVVKQGNLAVQV